MVGIPTIFAEAKRAGFSTAVFVGKEKFRHLVQPGTVDQFEFGPAELKKSSTILSRIAAKGAAGYILERKPNRCFIHFISTQGSGRAFLYCEVEVGIGPSLNLIP